MHGMGMVATSPTRIDIVLHCGLVARGLNVDGDERRCSMR